MSIETLRITEIFYSIQGEAATVGLPTVFIRLTGCPLRCNYCDTAYAFQGGHSETLQHILSEVARYQPRFVTVTGGEPLAQKECLTLLTLLCNAGYEVSLETSGAMSIEHVDPRVCTVMDLKTPSSGEMHRNLEANLNFIKKTDQLKWVIADRKDYDWARFKIDEFSLKNRVAHLLFSPSFGVLSPTILAEWMLADRLSSVRIQIQLHKYLWGNAQGK